MRKLLLALFVPGIVIYGHAQGTIEVFSISSVFSAYTSTAPYAANGTASGGLLIKTPTNAVFDYTLLAEPYNASLNGLTPTLSQMGSMLVALTGITNYDVVGGIAGPSHNVGSPTLLTTSWTAAQNSYTDGTGTEDTYVLVGWSAALGTSWQQVYTELTTGTANGDNYFGSTVFGAGFTGGGPNSLPAPDIFGVSAGEPNGLTSGPILYSGSPEPTTLALAGLGGLTLLIFRHKRV